MINSASDECGWRKYPSGAMLSVNTQIPEDYACADIMEEFLNHRLLALPMYKPVRMQWED